MSLLNRTIKTISNYKPSIRTIMIISYLFIMLMVALPTAFLFLKNNKQLADNLVIRINRESSLRIRDKIQVFFEMPVLINNYNAEILTKKMIDPDRQDLLMNYFVEHISVHPTVSSIYFANKLGGLANAGRDKAENKPYVIFTRDFKSGNFYKYALDNNGNRAQLMHHIPEFDARTRPWYQKASQSDGIVWSDIYPLVTGRDLSITSSRAVRDANSQLIGVVGVDIFLSDISSYLQEVETEPGAKTFILDCNGLLIASSEHLSLYKEDPVSKEKIRFSAADSDSPLVRGIANAFSAQYPEPGDISDFVLLKSRIDGTPYFISIMPFTAISDQNWLIVSATPQVNYLGIVNKSNRITSYLIIITMLLAVAFAGFLGNRIAYPVLKLDSKVQAISTGEWDVEPVPSHIKEFDDLASEIFSMKNSISRYIESLNREISERIRIEKDLIQAKEKAEDANRLKSSFLSNMSHELRTPLNGILGFSELLQNQPLDENSLEMATMIHSSGQRLHKTLDMLLDLSRIEANKQEIHPNVFDALSLARECVKLYLPIATKNSLKLIFNPQIERLFLNTDAHLLNHMLNELISNAIKYTPQGIITVSLGIEEAADKARVYFSVEDTGIGIATDQQVTAFEAFRQVSEGWGRSYEGTGLGLTITKKYANILGGDIALESELGKGSKFSLILPLSLLHDTDTESLVPPAEKNNNAPCPKILNILLVDDDPTCEILVGSMLKGHIRISYCQNGEDALKMIESSDFDAIMLDINLAKGMNGTEVLAELRKLDKHRDTPVIALTAYAMASDKENLLHMGFDFYVSKPFDAASLQEAIAHVCQNQA